MPSAASLSDETVLDAELTVAFEHFDSIVLPVRALILSADAFQRRADASAQRGRGVRIVTRDAALAHAASTPTHPN